MTFWYKGRINGLLQSHLMESSLKEFTSYARRLNYGDIAKQLIPIQQLIIHYDNPKRTYLICA